MRTVTLPCLSLVAAMCFPGAAAAQRAKRAGAESPPAKVGSCRYLPGADGSPSTILSCAVIGSASEFSARIAPDQAVVVMLDEPISSVIPASDPYVHIEAAKTFVAYDLLGSKLPKNWSSTIQTATYAVTLRLRKVDSRGDAQVRIHRGDRGERDAEVERRVTAARASLEADYKRKFDELDHKAAELARRRTVVQLQAGWSTAEPSVRPTRHDFVVLRAHKLIRIGAERYLQISIENRDRPTLHIGDITAWLQRGGDRDPVEVTYQCGTPSVRPGTRTRCILGLGLPAAPTDDARIGVRVAGRDGKRSVALSGIGVR